MTPDDEDEIRAAEALTDAGGPAALAPQLVAITRTRGLHQRELLEWIGWHSGKEWSAHSWDRHCDRVAAAAKLLEEYRRWSSQREAV
jgi:hypothetical protein